MKDCVNMALKTKISATAGGKGDQAKPAGSNKTQMEISDDGNFIYLPLINPYTHIQFYHHCVIQ